MDEPPTGLGAVEDPRTARLVQEIREVLAWSGVGSRWMLPGSVSSIGRSLSLTGFTGTSRSR